MTSRPAGLLNQVKTTSAGQMEDKVFPTPTRSDEKTGMDPEKRRAMGNTVNLGDAVLGLEEAKKLYPTPKASDAIRGENTPSEKRRDNPAITTVDIFFKDEVKALPTPTASLAKGADSPKEHDRNRPQLSAVSLHFPEEREAQLQNQDVESLEDREVEWGEYEPAIRRWEAVRGSAPKPVEPNRNGKPRLTSSFVEWMMGLPEGHVTQVPGVARSRQIQILGNGVVPDQAEAALRIILQRVGHDPAGDDE